MYREIISALREAAKDDSTIAVVTGTILIILLIDVFSFMSEYSIDMNYLLHI